MSLLNKKPLIIGLTGAIGSGKSTISKILEILGVPVYYSDIEAKKIYDDFHFQRQLSIIFGKEIFDDKGSPDKKTIARLIFHDKNALQKLNAVIHPQIRINFFEWAEKKKKHPYVVMESAILYEAGFDFLFDKIINVHTDLYLIIERVKNRDNLSEEQIRARLNNQMSIEKKKNLADFIILNNELQLVLPQILAIHKQLTQVKL